MTNVMVILGHVALGMMEGIAILFLNDSRPRLKLSLSRKLMDNQTSRTPNDLASHKQLRLRLPKLTSFRQQLKVFKWLIPIGLMLLVVLYEIGPSRWIFEGFGFTYHLSIEILIFGTVGPALAFVLLELLGRWIEEKETADLQARILARANEKELKVRQLNDDTLQVLFATSLLITTIKSDQTDLPLNTATQIEVTEQALDDAMKRLRSHLMG
jgi:signal transduction histidine kinase